MGISITAEKADKLSKNRAEGRLCAGGMSRAGCATRATKAQTQQSWLYKIDEGSSSIHRLTFCSRHALPVGYKGVNFIVLEVSKL